jgi:hypothetical protein
MYTTSIYDVSKIKKELNFKFKATGETLKRVVKEAKKASV